MKPLKAMRIKRSTFQLLVNWRQAPGDRVDGRVPSGETPEKRRPTSSKDLKIIDIEPS